MPIAFPQYWEQATWPHIHSGLIESNVLSRQHTACSSSDLIEPN
jgi:hypothetical protein